MKRTKGATIFTWVVLFVTIGSGLFLLAGAIADATFPRLTQFWVGGAVFLLGAYLAEKER